MPAQLLTVALERTSTRQCALPRSGFVLGRRAAGLAGFLPCGTEAGHPLTFCAFGEVECIFDINAKITDFAFDLRMAEQSRVHNARHAMSLKLKDLLCGIWCYRIC